MWQFLSLFSVFSSLVVRCVNIV